MTKLRLHVRNTAIEMYLAGANTQKITKTFRCSMRAIRKLIEKYKTMQSVADRPGHRRRRKTPAVEDQEKVRCHEESPFPQVKHIAAMNGVSV